MHLNLGSLTLAIAFNFMLNCFQEDGDESKESKRKEKKEKREREGKWEGERESMCLIESEITDNIILERKGFGETSRPGSHQFCSFWHQSL